VGNYYHRSFYDSNTGAVEAFIISRRDQNVRVKDLDLKITFRREEKIFNELSCKYDVGDIDLLAERSGFSPEGQWFDDNKDFALFLFKV
jgi:uncharacterized SAM-dependent methyltransferase